MFQHQQTANPANLARRLRGYGKFSPSSPSLHISGQLGFSRSAFLAYPPLRPSQEGMVAWACSLQQQKETEPITYLAPKGTECLPTVFTTGADDPGPQSLNIPHQERVRHLLYGCLAGIDRTIKILHTLGYADPNDWSEPIPTGKPNQWMVIMTKMRTHYSIKLTESLIMGRVCSRPQVHPAMGQSTLLWPERTICLKREARYRKRCVTAQRYSLGAFAQNTRPITHPTPFADYRLSSP